MASNTLKNLYHLSIFLLKFTYKRPITAASTFTSLVIGLFLLTFNLINSFYANFTNNAQISFHGAPKVQNWMQSATWNRTLHNDSFLVGYSDIRGNPLWVSYKLQPAPKTKQKLPRPSKFKADWRSINKIQHKDYTHSGYDRGHMAPNGAISKLYGVEAQLKTFLMTNISPQTPKLNRGLWKKLEQHAINNFTQLGQQVWVTTGPIFTGSKEYLKTSTRVEIPDAFYKIFAIESPVNQPKLLAYIIPQTITKKDKLENFIVKVDTIEKITGLDFFHELEDKLENKLEATIETNSWKIK